ncbi:Creatinase/aminopeptidase [Armillaria solidipes]|uniref:Creatinase/aminopeptidase n=1 Tax=Armillaria solidipes TaxID=1076256 RepID=A0A2H3BKZ4_9AGAR|nr:Creatinase/aminopeptidase [Armillaria solidipes]
MRIYLSSNLLDIEGTVFATVIGAPTEVRQLRERKSEGELELLKCANEATLLAIRHTHKHMHIGIRASEAQQLVAHALVDAGLKDGGNAALSHGSGTDRRLHPDECASLDCTSSLYGYRSDVARTLALPASTIPKTHLQIWNFVHSAQHIAFQAAHAGSPNASTKPRGFSSASQNTLHTALGHGIGLEM